MIALLAVVAFALGAGCADPYDNTNRDQRREPAQAALLRPPARQAPQDRRPVAARPKLSAPPASGQLPGEVPAELRDEPASFPTVGHTPERTAALAADLYGNWTSATAARRFEQIAELSVGQARAELRQAAAQSGTDPQQQDVTSRSRLEAIDLDGTGDRRHGLVVTRQTVDGPGLPQTGRDYQITVARLERRGGKWVISRWAPQP